MKKLKKELKSIISSNNNIRNGIPVFKDTRVPVYIVLKHLALGWSIKELEESYPAVKPEYIAKLLEVYSNEFRNKNDTKTQ